MGQVHQYVPWFLETNTRGTGAVYADYQPVKVHTEPPFPCACDSLTMSLPLPLHMSLSVSLSICVSLSVCASLSTSLSASLSAENSCRMLLSLLPYKGIDAALQQHPLPRGGISLTTCTTLHFLYRCHHGCMVTQASDSTGAVWVRNELLNIHLHACASIRQDCCQDGHLRRHVAREQQW